MKKRAIITTLAILFVGTAVVYGLSLIGNTKGENSNKTNKQSGQRESSSDLVSSVKESSDKEDSSESKGLTIDQRIEAMSLEEKVGQLFFVRTPEQNQVKDIQTYHLGGYVLFGRDVDGVSADQLKKNIQSYQAASKTPLLIGSDEEGGTVTRISRNTQLVPYKFESPQSIYATSGMQGIVQDVEKKSEILREYGIQTGLYPVADVATDPEAFIYDRTLGKEAGETSAYISVVVKTLKDQKIGSTLKHFPGYGNNRDSHVEIVTDTRTMDELRSQDFIPFHAGIDAGADSVLVNHNIVNAIDSTQPASISPAVHDLLRKEFGFNGVVMTDDMDMAGLAKFISQKQAGLKALQAGNDLVMSSSYAEQIPEVVRAIKAGEYSQDKLNESVKRVLTWKEELGLFN